LALVLTIQVWLMVLFLVYAAIHAVVRPGMITRRLSDGTCRVEHLQQDGTYKVKDYPRPEPPRPK
jgi:hypothetical protein